MYLVGEVQLMLSMKKFSKMYKAKQMSEAITLILNLFQVVWSQVCDLLICVVSSFCLEVAWGLESKSRDGAQEL